MAFLRGINVGGKAVIRMADLRAALAGDGFAEVATHIASGNVLFDAPSREAANLSDRICESISRHFSVSTRAAVFSREQWREVMQGTPDWWGDDPAWRHNLLILIPPCEPQEVTTAIGELRPGLDRLQTGPGVLYQSIALEGFTRSAGSRINRYPVYGQMTVRRPGTARRVLELLEAR